MNEADLSGANLSDANIGKAERITKNNWSNKLTPFLVQAVPWGVPAVLFMGLFTCRLATGDD